MISYHTIYNDTDKLPPQLRSVTCSLRLWHLAQAHSPTSPQLPSPLKCATPSTCFRVQDAQDAGGVAEISCYNVTVVEVRPEPPPLEDNRRCRVRDTTPTLLPGEPTLKALMIYVSIFWASRRPVCRAGAGGAGAGAQVFWVPMLVGQHAF